MNLLNDTVIKTIFNFTGLFMLMGIVIVYALATYWNIKFLFITKWKPSSLGKIYCAFTTFVFLAIESYLLVRFISGHPGDVTPFGTLIIRPAIFLMGGSAAATARSALSNLYSGGDLWTLRKPKI